jgi:ATP synthase protein I
MITNSLAHGRRVAVRIVLLQITMTSLAALPWLLSGKFHALSAWMGGLIIAVGTAVFAWRALAGVASAAGLALMRLILGMLAKWLIVIGGVILMVAKFQFPVLPTLTGMVVALLSQLLVDKIKF